MTFDPVACDNWLDKLASDHYDDGVDQDEIDTLETYLEDQEHARQDDERNIHGA